MRFIENVLAVIGLLALIGAASLGVLSLDKRSLPQAAIQTRMTNPMQCDATVSQRGAGEKWKTRCYIRKESS